MSYLITSICCYELILHCKNIFTIFTFCELVLIDRNGWLARIVSRIVCYLGCDSITRRCNSKREILLNYVIDLCSYFNSLRAVHVIVINSELIGFDILEYCYRIEAFGNCISRLNLLISSLVLPVIKYFSLNKRIIREIGQFISRFKVNKVLRLFADHVSVFIFYNERYSDLISKICVQCQIFRYC